MTEPSQKPTDIESYLRNYMNGEVIQSAEHSLVDPQLASIAAVLADKVSENTSGTILDVGCGSGTLLSRLAEIPNFRDQPSWLYAAIDIDDKLDEVQRLARSLTLSRRVEPISLSSFYSTWPTLGQSQIIFCRNVLHELTIDQTATFFSHVSQHISDNDYLIIQDFVSFPEGERHNACWLPHDMEEHVRQHGFERVTVVAQASRSGNHWFNLVATHRRGPLLTRDRCAQLLLATRQRQWEALSAISQEPAKKGSPRSDLIEALDIDLQLASLTRQLRDVGALTSPLSQEAIRRIRLSTIIKAVSESVAADKLPDHEIPEFVHFRERGSQLNALEGFLRSPDKLAIIFGGVGTGKTTLLNHLLRTRSYEKTPIIIDASISKNAWSFIEQIFRQLNIAFDAQAISVIDGTLSSILPSIRQILNNFGKRIIFSIDNFDSLLDSNNKFYDSELSSLISLLIEKEGSKLIVSTRREFVPDALLRSAGQQAPLAVRAGRYGTDQTVINVLDDHFDRGRAGLDAYPERLLEAIDRHPLVAMLAAQNLSKYGVDILIDERFVHELRGRLKSELWDRLVDDSTRPALEAATNLRVAVPAFLLEGLVGSYSIARARESELLYTINDRRWNYLLFALGIFRTRRVEALVPGLLVASGGGGEIDHEKISVLYKQAYRIDDDPKWLRESYYHRMLRGDLKEDALRAFAGRYYLPELVASAHYCYQKSHDYAVALELYDVAISLHDADEAALMRRASCLIRLNRRKEGEAEFAKLVSNYPNNIGIKNSHVDALLHVQRFDEALQTLERYELPPEYNAWVAQQWGRAYLGLDRYVEAEGIFRALVAQMTDDPYAYIYLARALQQHGAIADAVSVLRDGLRRFPENVAVKTSLGADLERLQEDAEAIEVLAPLFEGMPDNARAAISLMRVKIRAGDLPGARLTLERALRHAVPAMEMFLVTGRADLYVAEGRPMAAMEVLREKLPANPLLCGAFLDASYHSALLADDLPKRESILNEAGSIVVPDRLRYNVPVQYNRAKVAALSGNLQVFEDALSNLEKTKILGAELQRVREMWGRV